MFGMEILDIVIGLMFVYLLLALLATAVNEYVSALVNRRGKELARGIGRLLEDAGAGQAVRRAFKGLSADTNPETLTERFYNHPLIKPLATRRGRLFGLFFRAPRLPSYIPARTFAMALLDVIGYRDADAGDPAHVSGTPGARLVDIMKLLKRESPLELTELKGMLEKAQLPSDSVTQVMTAAAGAQSRLQQLHDGVEVWFNNAMDRVSGAYKRNIQAWLLFIGVVIALILNADTVQMWRQLSASDELRAAMVQRAVNTLPTLQPQVDRSRPGAASDTTPSDSVPVTRPAAPEPDAPAADLPTVCADTSAATRAACADSMMWRRYRAVRTHIDNMELKLGWTTEEAQRVGFIKPRRSGEPGWRYNPLPARRSEFWVKTLGLLLTGIAISLGAPFWFDLLNKVISIRAAGRSPVEKPKSPEGPSKRAAGDTPK